MLEGEAKKRYTLSLDLEAIARQRGWVGKADEIKKSGEEQGMIVSRFLDRHCGCSQSGQPGHGHGLVFVRLSVDMDKVLGNAMGDLFSGMK